MGNAPRILLRTAAFFLTLAIICTISAATMAGGVSASDEPDTLVPGISPVPKGEPEGSSSTPPITRNSPKPVSSQPPAPSSPAPQPPAPQPPAPQPPASNPPTTPNQPAVPVSQPVANTGTMPAALPATGMGFMAPRELNVRAVLNGVALFSVLLAASCASSGLAVARQRIGPSR